MDEAPKDDAPRLIGWREIVAIPDWGIEAIEAKVDTGARSSAIDVSQIEELPDGRVRFHVALDRAGELLSPAVETAVSRRVRIRSSLGHAHDRLIVRAHIQVAGVDKEIEIGLVRRRRMLSRMLLGRLALQGDFHVDPGRRYLFVKPARRKRKRRPASKDTP
ncbi:MAG: RimK/LysX family protein [Candidatus Krumholzibacteriia bacterium]|nr:ATP-dependent zinc protease [bacterium]MCB9512980.1 ATP-dependent zinc protease [Candidatus Latescibacterota bacterium]MCB9516358.1 ATP-dependent zinc protease [Candidatus Latescibacterota bacterium]